MGKIISCPTFFLVLNITTPFHIELTVTMKKIVCNVCSKFRLFLGMTMHVDELQSDTDTAL